MSTVKRIAKNAGIVFIGENALKILSIILVFLIARTLGDSEYGKFSFVLSFTGLFYILLDLGTSLLIVREIAQNKEKAPKIVSNILILKTITSIVVYGLIAFFAYILKYDTTTFYGILIAGLGIVFDSLAITISSVFQAYERMEFPVAAKIARILIRFAITVPLLLMNVGFLPILGVYVFVQFLNFIVALVMCFKVLIRPILDFDKDLIISLLKRSFPFLLSGIFVTLYFRVDITLMSKIAPTILNGVYGEASRDAIIGWYSAAYNILDGLISIALAVSTAILPVAIMYHKESKEKLIKLYHLSIKYLTYISIPIAVGITLLADKIIVLIYKYKYINSTLALQILVWTLVPLFINYMLGVLVIATNKEKDSVYILIGNLLVNLGLNIVLIPKLSLYGAALATVLTEIFYFSGYYFLVRKELGGVNLLKIFIRPIIACIAMAIAINALITLNVFVLIAIGAAIYFTVMYVLRAFSKEDFEMLTRTVRK
ncbi:MAG: flippase [archaeon]